MIHTSIRNIYYFYIVSARIISEVVLMYENKEVRRSALETVHLSCRLDSSSPEDELSIQA